jgi:hypothetical protein
LRALSFQSPLFQHSLGLAQPCYSLAVPLSFMGYRVDSLGGNAV